MIEAYLIVEDQTRQYAYKVTGTVAKAKALESALENNKPILPYEEWDILIAVLLLIISQNRIPTSEFCAIRRAEIQKSGLTMLFSR